MVNMLRRCYNFSCLLLQDVTTTPVVHLDTMESFWTAETLKYLWLLFGDEQELAFNTWVLNTEAHPVKIFRPGARKEAVVSR